MNLTLREARDAGEIERFVREREAEGVPDGASDKLDEEFFDGEV